MNKAGNGQKISVLPKMRRTKKAAEWFFLVLCAVAAGVGLNAVVSCLELWRLSGAYVQVRESQYAVPVLEGILRYGLFFPVLEELLFRGIGYRLLARWFPWQAAMVLSALLFGLYHGNLIQGGYAFVMGLLLAYMYRVFQSFAAPVVFHGAANLAVFLLSYSPGTIPDVALPVVGVIGCSLAAAIVCRFVRAEISDRQEFTDTVP